MSASQTIYLENNILSIAAKSSEPRSNDFEKQLYALSDAGYRLAISAWHIIEISKAPHQPTKDKYIQIVDRIKPLWLSNPHFIKQEEVNLFLIDNFPDIEISNSDPIFNKYLSQMWATYDGLTFIGETFKDSINYYSDPTNRKVIDDAANETPNAIITGRAAYEDGKIKDQQLIIDREYFSSLVPQSIRNDALNFIEANIKNVYRSCPAIAVEDCISNVRIKESFRPKSSDAYDLQHAVIGLSYCDYFVTDDKMLKTHAKTIVSQLNLNTVVEADILNINID